MINIHLIGQSCFILKVPPIFFIFLNYISFLYFNYCLCIMTWDKTVLDSIIYYEIGIRNLIIFGSYFIIQMVVAWDLWIFHIVSTIGISSLLFFGCFCICIWILKSISSYFLSLKLCVWCFDNILIGNISFRLFKL